MKRLTTRTTLTALALLATSGGLAACGSDSSDSGAGDQTKMSESMDQNQPSGSMSSDSMESDSMGSQQMDPAADLVGPGCAAYAKQVPDGAGSVQGMATDPVATAAGNNPLLTTLTKAVSGKLNPKVDLVDVLNGGQYTVFAPVDDAFAKVDKKTLTSLTKPAGAKTLEQVLTYHVVKGQLSPKKVTGTHQTVEGDTLKVTGSGNDLKVDGASVICGGVHTSNATVYLIDGVLMPKM